MVSTVFPDFGPNVGKISWITGSWEEREREQRQTSCLQIYRPGITSDSLDVTSQSHLVKGSGNYLERRAGRTEERKHFLVFSFLLFKCIKFFSFNKNKLL